MNRERLIEILNGHLFVSDEWGGEKLACWQYGHSVVIDGLDEAADEILKTISRGGQYCSKCGPDLQSYCGHCFRHGGGK